MEGNLIIQWYGAELRVHRCGVDVVRGQDGSTRVSPRCSSIAIFTMPNLDDSGTAPDADKIKGTLFTLIFLLPRQFRSLSSQLREEIYLEESVLDSMDENKDKSILYYPVQLLLKAILF